MLRLYQTPSYELWWQHNDGTFNLRTPGRTLIAVPGVEFLYRGKLHQLSGSELISGRISQETQHDSHGYGQVIQVHYLASEGLAISLRLCLYQTRPFVLLKVSATNVGSETLAIRRFFIRSVPDGIDFTANPCGFFTNGWFSLLPAGYMDLEETPHIGDFSSQYRSVPSFTLNRDQRFGRKGTHVSEMVGAIITPNEALIGGSVTTYDQFVEFLANILPGYTHFELQSHVDDMPLDVGASVSSEWLYLEWLPLPNNDPFIHYSYALKRQLNLTEMKSIPLGWRTPENKAQNLTEAYIFENVANAALINRELPVKRIEIAIDYLTEPAVWGERDTQRFLHNYQWIAERIKGSGFIPEISFSPFLVQIRSDMVQEHPGWLVKNSKKAPLVLHLSEGTFNCLDVTNPEVYNYLSNHFEEIVSTWGYKTIHVRNMLACSAHGYRYNPRLTCAQVLHRAYECLRKAVGPETLLIASESAFGPAIGMVDSMQFDLANSTSWVTGRKISKSKRTTDLDPPCVRDVILNTLYRSWMNNRLWINDSGPLTIDLNKISMTQNEYLSLISILGICGSAVAIIDDLTNIESIDTTLLVKLFPPLVEGLDAVDPFSSQYPDLAVLTVARSWGRWQIVALINWSDAYIEKDLPSSLHIDMQNAYHLVNFWEKTYFRITKDNPWPVLHLDPHSVALLSLRSVLDSPQVVSTSFHITQGAEITHFETENCWAAMDIKLDRGAVGSVWLALPAKPGRVYLNGQLLENSVVRTIAAGIYEVTFTVDGMAQLKVSWCDE